MPSSWAPPAQILDSIGRWREGRKGSESKTLRPLLFLVAGVKSPLSHSSFMENPDTEKPPSDGLEITSIGSLYVGGTWDKKYWSCSRVFFSLSLRDAFGFDISIPVQFIMSIDHRVRYYDLWLLCVFWLLMNLRSWIRFLCQCFGRKYNLREAAVGGFS